MSQTHFGLAAALIVTLGLGTVASAQDVPLTPLTLINNWTGGPFETNPPSVQITDGLVQFRGAIATKGTNLNPFVLLPAFRPPTNIYVVVGTANNTRGRLLILPNGMVEVQGDSTSAEAFTSLDGVWFALHAPVDTILTPLSGWTNAPFATRNAAVVLVPGPLGGRIVFEGALGGPASPNVNSILVFKLPESMWPSRDVSLPITQCGSAQGTLLVSASSGWVTVSDVNCFVSLEGVSFLLSPPWGSGGQGNLTPKNGWAVDPSGGPGPSAQLASGAVTFSGGIAGVEGNPLAFVLPPDLRPTGNVYVPIQWANNPAHNARLDINPNGNVFVQGAPGTFRLDGASFRQLDKPILAPPHPCITVGC